MGVVYGRLLRGENTKKDYSPIGSVIPYLLFKAVQSNLFSPHSKYVKEVFLLRSKLLSWFSNNITKKKSSRKY